MFVATEFLFHSSVPAVSNIKISVQQTKCMVVSKPWSSVSVLEKRKNTKNMVMNLILLLLAKF